MKITTLIIAFLVPVLTFSQTKYYDKNDKEITEAEFINKSLALGAMELKVFNDSLGIAKIVSPRYENGNLDSHKFLGLLNESLLLNLDVNKPTVIIYYPGKDPCNSNGSATTMQDWYKDLMKKSNKITPTNFLFIYKSKEGLKFTTKYTWYKDPKAMVEHKFFKYHYPCSSYVIIYNNKYYSYFGEFTKEGLLNNLEQIMR
jgi:hypothetical protein